MAISYPLSVPSALKIAKIRFTPRTVVGMSQAANTGQQQVQEHQGQWWELEITTPPLSRATGAGIFGFLAALNGRLGTFQIGDSVGVYPTGTIAGTVQVGAGAALGSTTLPLQGGSGLFAVGDWLQVSTSLYMVTQVNSGAGTVDVFPRLRAAYAQTTAVTYVNALGTFRLVDSVPFEADERRIYAGLSISAIEVVPTT